MFTDFFCLRSSSVHSFLCSAQQIIYDSFLTGDCVPERTTPACMHTLESWFLLKTEGYSAARAAIEVRAADALRAADAFFSANSDSTNFTTSLM